MKWRCPYCHRELEVEKLSDLPHMPFCSDRCLMADLNGWLSGHYVISRPIQEGDLGEAAVSESPPPDEDERQHPRRPLR